MSLTRRSRASSNYVRAREDTVSQPAHPLSPQQCDAVIFGGGVAGLWLLDELTRRGYAAVLFETVALGAGQTTAAQGILHSGLKYTLDGLFNASAEGVRDWPSVWRQCLRGTAAPRLDDVSVLAEHCYLWRTSDARSLLGIVGARIGLRVRPEAVPDAERPAALRKCPGGVFRLAEQVIDPGSMLQVFRDRHRARIVLVDEHAIAFSQDPGPGVVVRGPGEPWRLAPRAIILAAGAGNAALRSKLGLDAEAMQRRPLHMAMARGRLPMLFGHCVDGARTRVTITSAAIDDGAVVWQLGGQIAEDGVGMESDALIHRAAQEVAAVLPGCDLGEAEWSSYRVDRAEAAAGGKRPSDAVVRRDGAVITVWPTKLVLAPRAAELVLETLGPPTGLQATAVPDAWPRPPVAARPWEKATWKRVS